MFDLARELRFTYKELVKDIEGCLDKCEECCSKELKWRMRTSLFPPSEDYTEETEPPRPFTKTDREELKEYMLEFINDMKKYYP